MRWVFVSTCNVYADAARLDGDEADPVLEPLPAGLRATPETYGEGKVACELSVLEHRGTEAPSQRERNDRQGRPHRWSR